ncbi:MAG: Clp protease N-terminal domain-containing protein [Clostridia bacterium]
MNFTLKAKSALDKAYEYCVKYNYPYIGSEHILYGLASEKEGIAAKILLEQGITASYISEEIIRFNGLMDVLLTDTNIEYTLRSKEILLNSEKEAEKTKNLEIGTEHILLSLMKEIDSLAVRILIDGNVNPEKIFASLIKIVTEDYINLNNIPTTPTLNEYSKDLNKLCKEDKLDPLICRENELNRIIQILCRRTKNNPIILGEPRSW